MIALPATPQAVLAQAIVPALALLPAGMDSPEARQLLLAISGQESGWRTRQQDGGPAHGLWQCEQPVLQLVLHNRASADGVHALCAARGVTPYAPAMYAALLTDDIFAAGTARWILWCNPTPLPAVGDEKGAYAYYDGTWNPGFKRPWDWPGNYGAAMAALHG